jgi:hypothetical protein
MIGATVQRINGLLDRVRIEAKEVAGLVDIEVKVGGETKYVEERLRPELAEYLLDFLLRVLLLEKGSLGLPELP